MSEGALAAKPSAHAQDLVAGPSDATVAEVADEIRELHRVTGLRFAIEVGRLVLERFYAGDLELLRSRGRKDHSLRRLAEHPGTPLSYSALSRCVAIFEIAQRLGGEDAWEQLSASHLRCVIGLSHDTQAELLERADEQGWSVRRLADEAARHRSKSAAGRKPIPPVVKRLRALERYAREGDSLLQEAGAIDELPEPEVERLWSTVAELRRHLETLQKRLGARVSSD